MDKFDLISDFKIGLKKNLTNKELIRIKRKLDKNIMLTYSEKLFLLVFLEIFKSEL